MRAPTDRATPIEKISEIALARTVSWRNFRPVHAWALSFCVTQPSVGDRMIPVPDSRRAERVTLHCDSRTIPFRGITRPMMGRKTQNAHTPSP